MECEEKETTLSRIREDANIYFKHLDISHFSLFRQWYYLLFKSTFLVVLCFRLSSSRIFLVTFLFRFIYCLVRIVSGVQIPPYTKIAGGLIIPHYGTIVINKRSKIGRNCTMLHNVTLGAKGRGEDMGVPSVGDNCYLGAGCTLLGAIHVGDNSVVGAGVCLTKSVGEHTCVVGGGVREIFKL